MKYKNRDVHEVLREAMKSCEVPDSNLIEEIKTKAPEVKLPSSNSTINRSKGIGLDNFHYLKVAVLALAILLVGGVTVYAATQLLSPSTVADELGDSGLREAFESEDAVHFNETITAGGYRFTLLSMVSGYDLANYDERILHVSFDDVILSGAQTYIVIAVEREDGESMRTPVGSSYQMVIECWDTYPVVYEYEEVMRWQTFKFYPLVRGYELGFTRYVPDEGWLTYVHSDQPHPFFLCYTSIYLEGVEYYLIDIGNMKVFAEQGLYLGIAQSTEDRELFHSAVDFNPFLLEEGTGAIIPNPDFVGISIVFELSLDYFAESISLDIIETEYTEAGETEYIEVGETENTVVEVTNLRRSVRIISEGIEYSALEHWNHGFNEKESDSGWFKRAEDVADELSVIPFGEDFQIIVEGKLLNEPYYYFYKLTDGEWVKVLAVYIIEGENLIFLTHGESWEREKWEQVYGESFIDLLLPGEYILDVGAWWGNSEAADSFQNFFRLLK